MKLVKESLHEKFSAISDPIKDMGLVKLKLEDIRKEFLKDYDKKDIEGRRKGWHKFLSNLLNGKTITATLQKYPSNTVKPGTITVKNVIKSEYEDYFVKGEDGGRYRISPGEPLTMED